MLDQTNKSQRIEVLDSLRGIAAIVVVLHHCLYTLPNKPRWIAFSPLRMLEGGGQGAVLIFFVLSGFVLFEAYKSRPSTPYSTFIWRRFARIYPPFLFSIAFSATLYWLVTPQTLSFTSSWFNESIWTNPATSSAIALHLLLLDTHQDLNNVMWSLVHEMRISAIFPLIVIAVLWNWKLACGMACIISTAAAVTWWQLPHIYPVDLVSSARFIFLFSAGASLSSNSKKIQDAIQKIPRQPKIAIWLLSLILITYPAVHFGSLPTSIAAIVLVALCYSDQSVKSILMLPIFTWLGRVSYSLYLVHLPILATIVYLLGPRAGLWPSLALTVISSLLAAGLVYRYVEKPSIALGKFGAAIFEKKKITG